MSLIIELQYFPTVILFKELAKKTDIRFDLYDWHRKMSFRNRCVIAGGNGPINLSIPLVEGRDQRRPMKEVRIDNRGDWQGQHWKTITSCYNRSPWFEFYRHELEQLYQQPHEFLPDWNMTCWQWVLRQLGLTVNTGFTENYQPVYDEAENQDWRNRLLPATINRNFPGPVRYPQVFEDRHGFIPNLSILDLLFCEGKNALAILTKDERPG